MNRVINRVPTNLILGHIVGAGLIGQAADPHILVCRSGVAALAAMCAVANNTVDQHLGRQLQLSDLMSYRKWSA